jgi:hypothetical protein
MARWLSLSTALALACSSGELRLTGFDTCTPAGGVCVRTDAPMGASSPPHAVCVDYGVWDHALPYDDAPDLSCPSRVYEGTFKNRIAAEVCCFPHDAGAREPSPRDAGPPAPPPSRDAGTSDQWSPPESPPR